LAVRRKAFHSALVKHRCGERRLLDESSSSDECHIHLVPLSTASLICSICPYGKAQAKF
jgi:hypothetical protein